MPRFTVPRDIYYGNGVIEHLKTLKGNQKAMIITGGGSMKRSGFLDKTRALLEEAGLQVKLLEGVEPDPGIETVFRGAKEMQQYGPDVIVAIGGGSPMDAAKAMWVFYEYPELTFDDIKTPFTMPKLRKKAIFVAIPSTSGSASEVTAFSVITDEKAKIKYPLADFEITPDIAILDYDIPLSMPKSLTAHTGMDALTHAIEAYVSTAASGLSDSLALQSISLVFDYLLDSYFGDAVARGEMHLAQCLAGMAFSNALLGIVHSLAHKTGAQYKLSHGSCNAIMLPYVIQYNAKNCGSRYARIARVLGLTGSTDKQLCDSLVAKIEEMNDKLDIPQSFQEAGINEEKFLSTADLIAQEAAKDPCTASNPRPAGPAELREILKCCYYGEMITF